MTLAPGTTLGPYQIVAELGSGGMGVVYEAKDPRLKRTVAIKLLPPDLTKDDIAKQRFLQEAQAASALDHPNICTIHEINETDDGQLYLAKQRFLQEAQAASALDHPNICTIHEINETDDGQLYLVMAHYEGETLKERIEKGPLELDDAIDIATQMGTGLAEAHGAGIVHRDIKPANLFVTKSGTVKILDFGLAKLAGTEGMTQTGTTVGTVAYMSPEQARGLEVDHRTDIWSLGVVLYEMVAGTPPFQGENLLSLADAIRSREPEPLPGRASSLNGTLSRAMNKEAVGRYQAVRDLLDDVRTGGATQAPTVTPFDEEDIASIAVLPFTNMSADREQDYFCDGMAEEIINALTHVQGLSVSARTSSFALRGKEQDIQQIAKTLGVRTILEGSVRRAGARIRVTVQLINPESGYHLWSERYERELTDVFAIQDEMAEAVTIALQGKLLSHVAPRRYTPPLPAYEAYLRGRREWAELTPDALQRAVRCFEEAIALDPDFALAQWALGYCFMLLAWQVMPAREAMPLAKAAAQRALTINPSLPEAHALLGLVAAVFDYDHKEAERCYRTAMAHPPVTPAIRSDNAYSHLMLTSPEKAVEEIEPALKEDPLNVLSRYLLADCLLATGAETDARAQLHRILELDPTYWPANFKLGALYAIRGSLDRALACAESAHAMGPPVTCGLLAGVAARMGDQGRAERLVKQVKDRRTYGTAVGLAWFHVITGDYDRAQDWLEKAVEERDPWAAAWGMVYFKVFGSGSLRPRLASMMNLAVAD